MKARSLPPCLPHDRSHPTTKQETVCVRSPTVCSTVSIDLTCLSLHSNWSPSRSLSCSKRSNHHALGVAQTVRVPWWMFEPRRQRLLPRSSTHRTLARDSPSTRLHVTVARLAQAVDATT